MIAADQKAIIDSGSSTIVAPFKFLQYFENIIRKSYDGDIIKENGYLSVSDMKIHFQNHI